MFIASFLIGLREGLEAALIVSILLAYVRRLGLNAGPRRIWLGVGSAVVLTVIIGAVSTFGRSRLSFEAQEIIGGTMSLIAVAMVTWMVFWMATAGATMKSHLESGMDRALLAGGVAGVAWIAFVSVAREGIETTLMLWGWVGNLVALGGALAGIALAIGLGYGLYRGALRVNIGRFFTWSGAFLIVVSAGILAYGIHDLQEAAVLPGPFSGAPISPTHPRTGEVLTGFTDYPFWAAAFPFGWAFNVEDVLPPAGFLATLLKGTVGFVPQMSWLEVTAWALYLAIVVPAFIRLQRRLGRKRRHDRHDRHDRPTAPDGGRSPSPRDTTREPLPEPTTGSASGPGHGPHPAPASTPAGAPAVGAGPRHETPSPSTPGAP
jgi:high-affinity iron transporter